MRKTSIAVISALLAAILASGATYLVMNQKVEALGNNAALTGTLKYHKISQQGVADAANRVEGYSEKLVEIQALIDKYFVGDVDADDMTESLAEGMISGLNDRWSYYIAADEYGSYLESVRNAYVGIGVTISLSEDISDGILVEDVTPDSPADSAGIVIGDVITKVEGQSTAELGIDQTKELVRGEEGTDVTLTVRHEGVERDVTITRSSIKTVNVTAQLLEKNVAYIHIRNFDKDCAADTIAAIEEMQAQGAQAIVFDVRFNPGGMKQELVELLDYILPEGVIFRSELYDGTTSEDRSDASCLDLPMSVLVNGDSYSAAEFFAVALQEYGVAQVVGTQTCGKGYFQNCIPLSDGSAINISTGKYYTPNGISLVGVGVTPDIELEVSDEDYVKIYHGTLELEADTQLQAAIEAVLR